MLGRVHGRIASSYGHLGQTTGDRRPQRPPKLVDCVTTTRVVPMPPAMTTASFVSLQLARFDHLRVAGTADPGDRPGLLFCDVAADCRAAGTDPASREAFTFLIVGLHGSEDSADRLVDDVAAIAPWFADASERWSGVLAPFRTKGDASLIHRTAPARLFDPLAGLHDRDQPVVVLTTIGWNLDGIDMTRVQDIGTGTAAVRISMTAVPGLRSQQTFFFPGIIAIDPPTLTFWDNEASLVTLAHKQPSHKRQMDRYRTAGNADRASFTRLAALRSSGTWYGRDPVAMARSLEPDGSGS
jgi:hypothetical protein